MFVILKVSIAGYRVGMDKLLKFVGPGGKVYISDSVLMYEVDEKTESKVRKEEAAETGRDIHIFYVCAGVVVSGCAFFTLGATFVNGAAMRQKNLKLIRYFCLRPADHDLCALA